MKQGKSKQQNYVAKNMEKFNRPATHKDKKKESKINGLSVDEYWIDECTNEEYELHDKH
jgi:hypothetical protein